MIRLPLSFEFGAPVVDATQQIVLSFSANSWVDVRDSERKFKLFGEIPKGSRKVLGGQPPYKLVIGNAEAVSITVNGKRFDLAPYAKGNVARFTLDPCAGGRLSAFRFAPPRGALVF